MRFNEVPPLTHFVLQFTKLREEVIFNLLQLEPIRYLQSKSSQHSTDLQSAYGEAIRDGESKVLRHEGREFESLQVREKPLWGRRGYQGTGADRAMHDGTS